MMDIIELWARLNSYSKTVVALPFVAIAVWIFSIFYYSKRYKKIDDEMGMIKADLKIIKEDLKIIKNKLED